MIWSFLRQLKKMFSVHMISMQLQLESSRRAFELC